MGGGMGDNWRGGPGGKEFTLRMWAFHCWTPMRTFTVFCIRPADTTTAGICRVAAVTIFVVDILFYLSARIGSLTELKVIDLEILS
jgi:hypothetical protein